MEKRIRVPLVLLVSLGLWWFPAPVLAYGGPGSIVSGVGALLAALAAVVAAVVGFFWFPLKRLARKLRSDDDEGEGDVAETA